MWSLFSDKKSNIKIIQPKIAEKRRHGAVQILALEPRFMFDAAGVATVAETVNDPPPPDGTTHEIATADAKAVVAADSQAAQNSEPAVEVQTPAYQEIRAVDPDANQGKKEVVFIENNVADYQTLINGVNPGIEVVLLDGNKDGLTQIADWTQGHSGYDAIHIISHGADGQVNLGAIGLDAGTVQTRAADLATIGGALTQNGDILLYGCDVTGTEAGLTLIGDLASLTGADVAASVDGTGAVELGGNWALESRVGDIDAAALSFGHYDHELQAGTGGQVDTAFGEAAFIKVVPTTGGATGRVTYVYTSGGDAGKFLVTANDNDVDVNFYVYRYNADGTLDTSFGVGGKATIANTTGNDAEAFIAKADSNGKIILAGNSQNPSTEVWNVVMRLNSDGSLDTTYGTGGRFYFQPLNSGGTFRFVKDLAVLADGSVLVAGADYSSFDRIVITKITSSGAKDTGFGTSGVVMTTTNDSQRGGYLVVDGNYVYLGHSSTDSDSNFISKYSISTGAKDTTFGASGTASFTVSGGDTSAWESAGMVRQSDGKLVFSTTYQPGGNFAAGVSRLVRFNTDGTLDTSFGTSGVASVDLIAGQPDVFVTIAVQSDDKLLIAGDGTNIARFTANGVLDATFGTNGVKAISFPHASLSYARYISTTSDGGILVSASVTEGGYINPAIVRLFEAQQSGAMSFSFVTATQDSSPLPREYYSSVLKVTVGTNGEASPLSATSFTFNTTGTTATADLGAAALAYTGESAAFSIGTRIGSTVKTPNGQFTITGSQALSTEFTVFWLAYQPLANATLGNVVDAQATSVTIDGVARTPLETNPSGDKAIFNQLTDKFFTTDEWNTGNLSRVDADGANPTSLSNNGNGDPWFQSSAADVVSQKIFLSDLLNLYSTNLWGDSRQQLTDTGDVGQAIAVDSQRQKVFYFRNNNLYWMNTDGTGAQELLDSGGASFSDTIQYNVTAEVDEANGVLYFIGSNTINRATIYSFAYGNSTNTLTALRTVNVNNDSIDGIGLDATNGYVYYAFKDSVGGQTYSIRRMDTDGTDDVQFSALSDQGLDIYVRPDDGSLYWSDNLGNIKRLTLSDPANSVTDVHTSGTDGVAMGSQTLVYKPVETAPLYGPDTPILQSGSDTGVSGDNITSNAAPVLRVGLNGTNAKVGDTLELRIGGAAFSTPLTKTLTLTDLDTNGYVDFTVTSGDLGGDGTKSIVARLTQNGSGTTADSSTLSLVRDTTAPTLDGAGSTPADNATNIAVGDNIVIDFSENVQFGASGAITLRNVTQGQTAETFTVSNGAATGSNGSTATISGDKLTINPNGNLSVGTQYSLRFDSGSIEDAAGNDLAAITDDATYNFTTAAVPNTAPVIANLNGDAVAYTVGGGARVIDQGTVVAVTDAESADFDTGTLTVAVTGVAGTDTLGIRNQGASSGLIGVSGANVTYGGTTIGSFTGGAGSNLVVTFNANATPAAVTALMANITYATASSANASRTVSFTVTDGDGGTSTIASATITVAADATGTIYTVGTLSDADDNATIGADLAADTADGGGLSLREAIHWSNQNVGADTIVFNYSLTGSIVLTAGRFIVTDDLSIHGLGADVLTIDGDGQFGGFEFNDGDNNVYQQVLLQGLGFTNIGPEFDANTFNTYGAILNYEHATVRGVAVDSGVYGIASAAGDVNSTSASLLVENSSFSGALGYGVSIYGGEATFNNVSITGNGTDTTSSWVTGAMNLSEVASVTLNNVYIAGNIGGANQTSGIYVLSTTHSGSTVTITNSTITENYTTISNAYSAAVMVQGATVNVYNSTIYNNIYGLPNGVTTANAPINAPSELLLVGNNDYAGAINIYNSVVWHPTFGPLSGFNTHGVAWITNDGNKSKTITINNSISGMNVTHDVPGNSFADATRTTVTQVDPSLSATALNGGVVNTLAIGSSSPSVNYGDYGTPPATDSRGFIRNVSGGVDGGAYEYGSTQFQFVGQSRPLDGAVGVAMNTNIVLDFGSTIAKGTGNVRIYNADTNALLETIDIVGASVTVSGSRATINPSDLPSGSNIYVEVDAGAFTASVDGGTNNATSLAMRDATGISFRTTTPTGPAVSSINRTGSADEDTSAASVSFTVTFSESVDGVDVNDFELTTTGVSGASITGISGSGDTYTVTVSTGTGDGTIRLDLKSSGTGIENGDDAAVTGGYTSGESYTIDRTAPGAPTDAIDLADASDTGSSDSDNLTKDTTPTVRISLTGTNAAEGDTLELLLGGNPFGTPVTYTLTGTDITNGYYDFTLTDGALGADGEKTLTARVTDAAGNVGDAGGSLTITLDATAPTLSISNGSAFTYTENGAAAAITGTVTLTEAGTAGGASLAVQITSGNHSADTLSLSTTSSSTAGVIWLDTTGNKVMSGSTQIGTAGAANTTNGTAWTITFAAGATAADIKAVIEAIRYHSTSENPGTTNRTVSFTLTDGAGNAATAATRTVAVTAVNDAPTFTSSDTASISTYDGTGVAVKTLVATDVESDAITYSIVSGNTGGVFSINASTGAITVTGDAANLSTAGYTLVVRATDNGSPLQYVEQNLTVSVTDTLVVTTANDTSENAADAYGSGSYASELADGGGLSLREALGLASAGGKTIGFAAGLNGGDISLDSTVGVAANTTFQLANGTSFTISGSALVLTGGLTVNNAASNNLTISSNLTDNGTDVSALTKSGAGTLTLGGTNNTAGTGLNGVTVSGGTLQAAGDANLSTGGVNDAVSVTLQSGGTLKATGTGSFTIDNKINLGTGGGTIEYANTGGTDNLRLTGVISGGDLTKTGVGLVSLDATNTFGAVTVSAGTLGVSYDDNLGSGAVTLDGGTLRCYGDGTSIDNAFTVGAGGGGITLDIGVTFSGLFSGSGLLTKSGTALMTLSDTGNEASFGGGITVAAGGLSVAADENLGSGTVTLAAGTTLYVTGATTVDNAVTLTGAATIDAGAAVTGSGAVTGAFTLTKAGSGTLTLSNTGNGYGAVTVSAGGLSVAGDNNLGSGTVTLAAGTTLYVTGATSIDNAVALSGAATIDASAAVAMSGAFSGGNRLLTKAGTGTLTLSNTGNEAGLTGGLTVSAGGVSVADDNALTGGTLTLAAGTALYVTGATSIDNAVTMTGSATVDASAAVTMSGAVSGNTYTLTKAGTGTLTLSNTSNSGSSWKASVTAGGLSVGAATHIGSGDITLNGGTLINTGTTTLSHGIALGASGGTVQADGATILSGVIGGAGALTKTGTSLLTLSGNNTFTGAATVSAGAVLISHNNGLGTTAGATTVESGATLRIGDGLTVAENLTISGVGVNATYGALKINEGTGSATLSGTVTLAADASIGAYNSGDALTISGVISGGYAMTKVGSGTLVLSGANTYTGTTTISVGTLSLSGGSAVADGSAVTMSGTAALIVGASESIGALTGVSGNTITLNASAGLTVSQTTNTTFAGTIVNGTSSTGSLTKTGSGTLTLSGDNGYTGATTVSAGGLTLDHSGGTLADTSAVTVASGATLTLNQSDTVGSISGAGAIALGANTLTAGGDNASGEFSGAISGADGNLIKAGTGTLTLSGANTYTGTTAVQGGGTLSIAGDGNLGSGALTLNASTLNVTGATTIDNAITLTGAAVITNSAAVTLSGVLSGTGSLTMSGSAALTLSNANSYSGATTVSSGRLHLTGSLNATSGVSVSSGATLSGTGSIFATSSTNTLTVAVGGYLAPGTVGTAGQLTVNGNLTLNGTMKLDLTGTTAGTGYDQVVVNGTVTLGAASAFDVTYSVVGGTNNTFVVIDNNLTDAVSGTLNGVAEDGTLTSNARNYKASYIGGSGNDVTLKDNSPPVFTSTAVTAVNEDAAYSYTVTTDDTDGDTVTVTATTLPSWLTFTDGVLSGTPTKDEVGTHTVVLSASDGAGGTATQTFTVTVAFVNDTPVITTSPGGSVNEDTGYSYTPAATDEEGETITWAATTLPSWLTFSNGVLSGTPGQNDVKTHTVVLTATDASGAVSTQTFTITVNGVNDAPSFSSAPTTTVNEDQAYNYTVGTSDEEGEAVTVTATTLPSWLTFTNGVLSGTPGQSDVGTHTVTLTATDASGAKTTQTFTITVNGVNDAPAFTSTAPTTVNEDAGYSYTPTATDEEGSALTFTATTLPSWLTFSNGVLSGTPGQADVGTHTVTLTATDASGGTVTQTFTVTVNGVNDAPVFTSAPATSVNEKSTYSYTPTATDEEGSALTFTATTLPSWLKFENGVLSGTPGQGDVGTHTVTLTATDASGGTVTQTFTITVNDVNDAPSFSSGQPGNATAGQAFSFGLSATDPDGGTLSFGATGLPSWLTLTDNGNGTATLSGAPGAGDVGAVSVTVRVTDAGGAAATQVLSFNVAAAETTTTTGTTTTGTTTTGTGATLNITQTTTTSTTTSVTTSSTSVTGSTTGTSSTTTTGGTGTNAGTGSTTVAIISGGSGGATAGGSSSGPGGSEVGRDSPATVRVGNVDGNASSATGIQQTQGLTSTVTSADPSASADGSTLVRNAARGDSAATSSFYGASTILSLSNMSGGSSAGGSGGFGAGASGGFGGSGSGSSFGASAGGLGGGLSGGGLGGGLSSGSQSGGTGGSGLGSGAASTGGATSATGGATTGGGQIGGTQSGAAGGTGSTGTVQSGPVQGRSGGDAPAERNQNQGQGVQRATPATGSNAAPNAAPTQGDQGRGDQGRNGQGQGQGRSQGGEAPATTGGEQPAAPAPTSNGTPNTAPGPQTGLEGMDGLFRGAWALGPQQDGSIHGPAPLPGRGISEQLAYAHLAFDRQTARLEAAAAALRSAA